MTLTTPTKFLKVVLNIYVFATVVLAEQLPQIEDKEEAGAVQEIHGGIPHSSGSTNLVLKLLFILLVVGVVSAEVGLLKKHISFRSKCHTKSTSFFFLVLFTAFIPSQEESGSVARLDCIPKNI